MEKGFLIDAEKCTGCRLCVIACKDEHVGSSLAPWTRPQPDTGHFWIDVRAIERGRIPRVRVTHLPLLCQHCANAPCVKACPESAIKTRADGLVWIDPRPCTGCGLCQDACPYGVIYMNSDLGIAQKCTGCAHRVDEGALPRCAEICPHEAILFGDSADGEFAQKYNAAPDVCHAEYQTRPLVRWSGLPKPWIAGTVIDRAKDEIVRGASVLALDLFADRSHSVLSDEFGDFWIRGLERGRKYRLEIRKEGYEKVLSVVTTDGDQDLGNVYLKPT